LCFPFLLDATAARKLDRERERERERDLCFFY
jgi:hypothetical protein